MAAFKNEKEGKTNKSDSAIFLPSQVDKINTYEDFNVFLPPHKNRLASRDIDLLGS